MSETKEAKKEPEFVSKSSKVPPVSGHCPVDGSKLEVAIGRPPVAPPEYKGQRYHSCSKCSYFYVEAA